MLAFVVATQLDSAPPQTAAVVEPVADYPPVETVTIPVRAPDGEAPAPAVQADDPAPRPSPPRGFFFTDYVVDPQLDSIEVFGGSPAGPTVPPPADLGPLVPGDEAQYVARMIEVEIERIDVLLAAIQDDVYNDRPVDPGMLREITESIALVAEQLEAQPDAASKQQVISYLTQTAHGRTLLAAAKADEQNGRALGAARRAAQDGVVVASHYIREHY